jgi:hypothetical protein
MVPARHRPGAATALVKRGDTVVFADVNADGAKQVVASLGSRALAVGLDVGDADAVTQLVVDNVVGEIVAAVRPGMPVPRIAEVACTSPDRVRDVIHNFDADGFDALYPRYRGGRPATFSADQRAEITKIARGPPTDHGLPVSTLEPAEAGRAPGRQGGGRQGGGRRLSATKDCACCWARRAGPFNGCRAPKTSTDPNDETKKNRVLELSAIADAPAAAQSR